MVSSEAMEEKTKRPLSSVCPWPSSPCISPNCPSFTHVCFCVPISSFYKDIRGFPGGASGKEFACQCRRHRDVSSIPGSGRSPGGGHGNPFQYSCLENSMDRGAWQAKVHRDAKIWTQLKRFSPRAGDLDLIPGSGRSPGEGNGSPLQYSCLGNPMDRGAWQAKVHGVAKESDTT